MLVASDMEAGPGTAIVRATEFPSIRAICETEEERLAYKKVYEEIINSNIKSIMIGHIALPCYDEKDEETNLYPPATLSYRLMTKLLKDELGFEGLIISDATEMSGFC